MSFSLPRLMRAWSAAALAALLASAPAALAQTPGAVTGTVVDETTGDLLIGVNIVVEGTATGTTTDLDGAYRLPLAPGTYDLVYSYIGFDGQTIRNVAISGGRDVALDVQLSPTSVGLGEVTIEATAALSNTESSLLAIQSRAPSILDGISAQQMRRSPDANSGEALRRVTGVTVSGGRFVYVRGVPERYNGTLLNGTPVPSTEPDRRAFAYDLIPSNLLDNVLVAKSATPDLPGDFAGGVLLLNTIDFPEELSGSVSLGTGFSNATGASLLYDAAGGNDVLGFGASGRALPAGFPAENIGSGTVTDEQRAAYGQMLGNGWVLRPHDGPVTPNFSANLGGSARTRLGRLGAVGALAYRSGYALADVVRREVEGDGSPRFDFSGEQYGFNVTWGGLLNLSYRPSNYHSFSFKNFYTRTADDLVTQLFGAEYVNFGAEQRQTAIQYVARDLYSGQLGGEHYFPGLGRGAQLDWALYHALTTRDEPDYRRAIYQRPLGDTTAAFQLLITPTVGLQTGGRFFSDLAEGSWGGTLKTELPLGDARVTVGGLAETRDRDFTSRLLSAVLPRRDFDFGLLALPLDSVFAAQNFGRLDRPGCEDGGYGCEGFLLSELRPGGSSYTAGQDLAAGYAMVDLPLTPLTRRLRFVGGVRLEHALQTVESTAFQGDSIHVRAPYTNLLPSFNLTYELAERTNLRFAYSRNLNRPELRELAPFQYYDFELQTTVYGNDSLRQATINNVDLRFETYPGAGQLLSASLFYKHFEDPIERVIVPGVSLDAERSFANADYAVDYGFELEGRLGLGFLGPYFEQSGVLANYTWVKSEVTTPGSATVVARTGRPLQGQSPYVINLGLNLVEPRYGTAVSVLYNRLGSRIVEVATALESDVVEAPRDVVDLSVVQPLLGRYELRLTARDLLGQAQRFTQAGELTRSNVRGRSVSIGVSARL